MILPYGIGTAPDTRGLYAANVNGGWKILEWVGSIWTYPGTQIVWRECDVQEWFGPLPAERKISKEYDL